MKRGATPLGTVPAAEKAQWETERSVRLAAASALGPAGSRAELEPPPLFPPAVCCSSVPNQAIICFISLLTDSACK